jgi:hypothetical protein
MRSNFSENLRKDLMGGEGSAVDASIFAAAAVNKRSLQRSLWVTAVHQVSRSGA